MAEQGLQGLTEALRKLEDIGGEQGKFVKQSLRTVLREEAKKILASMRVLIKQQSGITTRALKVRAVPRKRNRVGMMAGVFYMGKEFYAGWANYGHKIGKGGKKMVKGSEWTERVKSQFPAVQETIAARLTEEIEAIAGRR